MHILVGSIRSLISAVLNQRKEALVHISTLRNQQEHTQEDINTELASTLPPEQNQKNVGEKRAIQQSKYKLNLKGVL
jgi:hypothetical protein